ncbi:MAG: molybdenum cofactor biosynthesis protein MoaE [Desulfobacteraceae bacterium]|nr:molybdenum cofactor biosynthesis protein MoaE [Desulfobacteraceae bacterium]
MNMESLIQRVKDGPDFHKAGMILCHNGVVRGTSRDGRPVTGLRVAVDQARLDQVLADARKMTGVIDVQVHIAGDCDLAVGDDVMYLVVAGDVRENVIAALTDTLNTIKTAVTGKTEYFAD